MKKGKETLMTGKADGKLYKMMCSHTAMVTWEDTQSLCIDDWHRVLGHRNIADIKKMTQEEMTSGMKINKCSHSDNCIVCHEAKCTKLPFPKRRTTKTIQRLDLVHTDVCGPMEVETPSGKRYVLTLIDDYTKYTKVFLLRHKSEAVNRIKEYVKEMETQFGTTMKIIRSDRGGEYTGKELKEFYAKKGIKAQTSAPHTPEQNGLAERKNRSLVEMTRCLLRDAKLPKKYWGEALNTAAMILNRVLCKDAKKTPYEMWYNKKPNIAYFKPFGCAAIVHRPKQQRLKLDNTGQKLTFVGYEDGSKAYRLLDMNTSKVYVSRNVYFIDQLKTSTTEDVYEVEVPLKHSASIQKENEQSSTNGTEEEHHEDNTLEQTRRVSSRTTKGIPPVRLIEVLNKVKDNVQEDPNVQEALERKDNINWQIAMIEEIEGMNRNQVWDLVEPPKNQPIIGCKWVFKTKTDTNGTVDRYKARLVAQGYSQRYGHDYNEVFAPVLQPTTLRILLAVAGQKKWPVRHYDVESAFLNGNLEHDVYMKQPEYIKKPDDTRVCKLRKSIYGLKQGAREWYKKWKKILCDAGLKRSKHDHCLFSKSGDSGTIFVGVHVDDVSATASDEKLFTQFEDAVKKHVKMKCLGDISNYLGIQTQI